MVSRVESCETCYKKRVNENTPIHSFLEKYVM